MDATDLELQFQRFQSFAQSIKSNRIYRGKMAKFSNFGGRGSEQKEDCSCTGMQRISLNTVLISEMVPNMNGVVRGTTRYNLELR